MATHNKFMKLLQKRMRRACGIKDDSLAVEYYMTNAIIVVIVRAKNHEMAAMRQYTSLEAFIWALILDEEKEAMT